MDEYSGVMHKSTPHSSPVILVYISNFCVEVMSYIGSLSFNAIQPQVRLMDDQTYTQVQEQH